jgi:hypothetical protein
MVVQIATTTGGQMATSAGSEKPLMEILYNFHHCKD